MSEINDVCYIDGKEYLLSDVEAMGFDDFCVSSHIAPRCSLFKYFPNKREYVREKKQYRNYSFEALENNTVFLQDAQNFDDCFDCAVDLEWKSFLNNRVINYCKCFGLDIPSVVTIDKLVHILSLKLYKYGSAEETLKSIHIVDLYQKEYIEVFIRRVFNTLILENKQWGEAIISAVKKEYDDFIKTLSKFKISCFSTSPYLNRMWSSAYANNNQGFCVEYEIDVTTEKLRNLYINIYPVIYSQHRNDFLKLSEHCDLLPTKEDLWQMYFNGLLRKSLHWKDQQEWRLILPDGLIEENPLPFFRIKKVYLGNKMPPKERKKIINYCRKHTIKYVGLKREINSFNLVECQGDCHECLKELKSKDF